MIEQVTKKRSFFDGYMFEAPGDEDDGAINVTVAPRANRGRDYSDDTVRVTARPTASRGATDYGADDDDAGDTADAGGDDTATDYAADDDTGTDDAGGEDTAADEGDTGDDTDTATDYGADDDDAAADTGDDTGDDGDGASEGDGGDDTDGPTDYGADDDGGGDDSSGSEDSGDQSSSGGNNNKGEALRKYHMYARFQHLYNVIETFIEKLRDVVKDDPAQNAVIKRVTTNFTNLHDNLYDFMMVRFSQASYVELLVYIEQAAAVCKLNFELLKNNRIELKQYPNDWN